MVIPILTTKFHCLNITHFNSVSGNEIEMQRPINYPVGKPLEVMNSFLCLLLTHSI